MSEWVTAPLHSLAEIRVSNVDKKTVPSERPVRLCNYMDVYGNDYIRSDIPFMEATASAAEISRLKVDHGDVMITKDSETPSDIGIPAVVMDQIDDLVCGYHLALIKPNRNVVDSVYLAKQLATDETARYFGRYAAGSTRYGLSNGAIAKTRIRLAPLPQQQKIAAILTSIDTAIEKTEALIEKYQQTKAGLMHDLFTRGVLPNSQLRPPREQAPELYQETAIGWIPRDWNVCTLRSCLTSNPTNGIYKSSDQIGLEGVLMVGQTAFTAERSVEFSLCRRGVISSGDLRRYGLSKGNILVTRVFATVQGVGLPTLVPELSEPAVFESNMMRLQIDLARIVPRLLFEWLRSPAARRYIYAGANASNQCSVNQSVLNPMPVPCPHIEEQARIVSRIDRLDERHFSECSDLQKLLYQKLGLMQDLLTGKVPVKVGAGETANHSERHP